jgi:hypothetical protein
MIISASTLRVAAGLSRYYLCDDCGPGEDMTAAYNTIRELDPWHLTVGAGFAGNKAQYTDSQVNGNGQHKLDTLPMLPSITCDKAQGAAAPKPCESRFPAACDRSKNPTGGGCCVSCGNLASILPVTGLSLDIVMIENYSPSMDAHAKDDAGTLRKGVPWQTMVNCDGSCEYLISLTMDTFFRLNLNDGWMLLLGLRHS